MEDGTVIVGKSPKMTVDFFKVAMKRAIRSIINKRMPFDDMLRLAISYDYEHQTSDIESNNSTRRAYYRSRWRSTEWNTQDTSARIYTAGGGISKCAPLFPSICRPTSANRHMGVPVQYYVYLIRPESPNFLTHSSHCSLYSFPHICI